MSEKRERATYGAAAFAGMTGALPTQCPRSGRAPSARTR